MIEAIIFDMDGVLIDSEPFWQQAEIEVFATVGIQLTHEMCRQTMGLRIDEVVNYWFQRQPWSSPAQLTIAEQIVHRVEALIRAQGSPKAGVHEILEFLTTQPVTIALATSSAYTLIDAVMDGLGIRSYFRILYSATDEEYGKPHPGVYLTAANRLNIAPTACLAIEDSVNGVLAAKAARMTCLAIPEGYPHQDPKFVIADQIVGSLLDLEAHGWESLTAYWQTHSQPT